LLLLQSWRASAAREAVAVTVGAPESRGAYLKKYTSFLVAVGDGGSVRRRYSDFAWLRAVLHARYTGLLVPSLPDKTAAAAVAALRGQEEAALLLRCRTRGLTLFLSAVLASPYLRSDAAVQIFLSVADEVQWEAAKKVGVASFYGMKGTTES
jgi:sorting nexin-8